MAKKFDRATESVETKAEVLQYRHVSVRRHAGAKALLHDEHGTFVALWHSNSKHEQIKIGEQYIFSGSMRLISGKRVLLNPTSRQIVAPARKPIHNNIAATEETTQEVTKKPKSRRGLKIAGAIATGFVLIGMLGNNGAGSNKNEPAEKTQSVVTVQNASDKKATATNPVDCEIKEVPFDKVTTNDPSMPKGQTKITVAGVNGQDEICYPQGRDKSATITHKTLGTAQLTAVGTYVAPTPVATPPPTPPSGGCHPSYTPCVPNVAGDINCPAVGMRVQVTGPDIYGLDGDNDGIGCESY